MENASNALLMAGAVLISIMLISLGTYLFATFGNYSKNINDTISQKQIDEFNSQFTKYETSSDGSNYCTAYDIVTVINLAKDYNSKYEEFKNGRPADYDSSNSVYIHVTAQSTIHHIINEMSDNSLLNTYIKLNIKPNGELYKYKCSVNLSEQTGLVKSIKFDVIN